VMGPESGIERSEIPLPCQHGPAEGRLQGGGDLVLFLCVAAWVTVTPWRGLLFPNHLPLPALVHLVD
jgi:hypothetical protein